MGKTWNSYNLGAIGEIKIFNRFGEAFDERLIVRYIIGSDCEHPIKNIMLL